jgi:hypothetical protein
MAASQVMVWYFVTDTHKVMTMLILVVLVLVLLELPQSSALKSIIVIS